ncbi:YjfB family protein [Paenibacillus macquariensis]|uniref:Motility protein n=1 Tax=Paenibacillus macquariensis TaxID=948756 RepID=A0ABY1JLP8_9BACL|nr:YjfB family protein [Paenibacillus macquariensis]MEC0090115.1 YjfB family protein [Paenibacillus macquariensis]SIQ37947.1 Putative motility protein [Paenibacillus macquariensis]
MDIAALSIGLAQSNLKQAVGISVLNMSKDQASGDAQALVKMLEQSVQPNLGGNIDIKA